MEIKTSSINLIATAKDGGKDVLRIGLKEAFRDKPQYQRYLRKEYERGKDFDNANIFKYIDIKDDPAVGLCIDMEWEDSRTLAEWLREEHTADEKKRIVRQVAEAIGYIHGTGAVLGYLNSHDIFITRKNDDVKLMTVKLRYADILTQPTEILKYLAPEAKDGTVGIDARADVFSLGVLLKDMGFMAEYHNVIERCCRFGRNERFDDVDSFLEAVDRRHYTRSTDELTDDVTPVSSNKKMAVIVAIIVVLAAVVVAMFVAQGGDGDSQASQQAVEQTQAGGQSQQAAEDTPDLDSTAKQQPATQPGVDYGAGNEFLNELVPQMQTDLDKIYNSGADNATIRKKVTTYYKGLRRVLKKQGKTSSQLDAFDKAFSDYTKQKNQ